MRGYIILVGLLCVLIISGCTGPPQPKFEVREGYLDSYEVFRITPQMIQLLKSWNKNNPASREIILDPCNSAKRVDPFTWTLTLHDC